VFWKNLEQLPLGRYWGPTVSTRERSHACPLCRKHDEEGVKRAPTSRAYVSGGSDGRAYFMRNIATQANRAWWAKSVSSKVVKQAAWFAVGATNFVGSRRGGGGGDGSSSTAPGLRM